MIPPSQLTNSSQLLAIHRPQLHILSYTTVPNVSVLLNGQSYCIPNSAHKIILLLPGMAMKYNCCTLLNLWNFPKFGQWLFSFWLTVNSYRWDFLKLSNLIVSKQWNLVLCEKCSLWSRFGLVSKKWILPTFWNLRDVLNHAISKYCITVSFCD